jgi:hypothetical protein
MASLKDIYKKSDFNKLPVKKDRTPITDKDFDLKKLSISEQNLEKQRGGKLGSKTGGYNPVKKYSSTNRNN